MPRRNHVKHSRRPMLTDRYDLDYVSMPEYPQYTQFIVKPLKTIFVNLDAAFEADDFYVIRSYDDHMMRKLEKQIEDME